MSKRARLVGCGGGGGGGGVFWLTLPSKIFMKKLKIHQKIRKNSKMH
jgi:hypothetical protein